MKTLILSVILFVSVVIAGYVGLSKHERAECEKWLAESQKTPDYYFTRWQKNQCDTYLIELPIEKLSRMYEKN